MSKYWVVYVSIPFSRFEDMDATFLFCQELEAEVGGCGGGGAGFGNRDMDWSFDTEAEALEHEQRLLSFFSERVIPTQDDFSDGEPVQINVDDYDKEEVD